MGAMVAQGGAGMLRHGHHHAASGPANEAMVHAAAQRQVDEWVGSDLLRMPPSYVIKDADGNVPLQLRVHVMSLQVGAGSVRAAAAAGPARCIQGSGRVGGHERLQPVAAHSGCTRCTAGGGGDGEPPVVSSSVLQGGRRLYCWRVHAPLRRCLGCAAHRHPPG